MLVLATASLAVSSGASGSATSAASTVTFSGSVNGPLNGIGGGPECTQKFGSVLGRLSTGELVSIGWTNVTSPKTSFPSHSATFFSVQIAYGDSIGALEWQANQTTGKGTLTMSGPSSKPHVSANVTLKQVRGAHSPARLARGPLTVKGAWSC